eukprot:5010427-Amphidinium_carterae.2
MHVQLYNHALIPRSGQYSSRLEQLHQWHHNITLTTFHYITSTTFHYRSYDQKIHKLLLESTKKLYRAMEYDTCEYSNTWPGYDHKEQLEVEDTKQGYSVYLRNDRVNVRLHNIGHHFHIKAAMINGCYKNVDYTTKFANWYNERCGNFKQENMVWGTGSDDDPNMPVHCDYALHNEDEQTTQEAA